MKGSFSAGLGGTSSNGTLEELANSPTLSSVSSSCGDKPKNPKKKEGKYQNGNHCRNAMKDKEKEWRITLRVAVCWRVFEDPIRAC